MAWCRGRGWIASHPGHGPWSHIPPWERPGWYFGGGWCWYWLAPYWRLIPPLHTPYPFMSKDDEVKYLEELKKYITDVVLRDIERRLEELKGK